MLNGILKKKQYQIITHYCNNNVLCCSAFSKVFKLHMRSSFRMVGPTVLKNMLVDLSLNNHTHCTKKKILKVTQLQQQCFYSKSILKFLNFNENLQTKFHWHGGTKLFYFVFNFIYFFIGPAKCRPLFHLGTCRPFPQAAALCDLFY